MSTLIIFGLNSCGGGTADAIEEEVNEQVNQEINNTVKEVNETIEKIKTKVNGQVVLNTVRLAKVTIQDLEGNLLGSGTTTSEGNFEITLDIEYSGAIRVLTDGGTYTSEANISKEETSGTLCSLLEALPTDVDVMVTALTNFSCKYVDAQVAEGNISLADAMAESDKKLSEIFGFTETVDFETLSPNLTKEGLESNASEALIALISGVFEKMADRFNIDPATLYELLAEDFSDGTFDGKNLDVSIEGASKTPYNDFLGALDDYLDDPVGTAIAEANLSKEDFDTTNVQGNLVSGIINAAPVSSGLNIGSSGAVTTLSIDSKQYVYIAGRTKGLIGLDVTHPDEANKTILDLKVLNNRITAVMSDENISDETNDTYHNVGGVIAVPGLKTPAIMVYAYDNPIVVLVDVANSEVLGSLELNITGQQTFSGGNAYISSGISDPAKGGVWLATYDGYWFVDVSTMQAHAEPIALANNQIIAENIGSDISKNMLFSPNYGDDSSYYSNGGLQWVDLNKNIAYSLNQTTWDRHIGLLSGMSSADAGSIDSTFNIGIISPEDSSYLAFIDMSNMENFTFNDINQTFDIEDNASISSFNLASKSGGNPVISHASVDSSTHLMLLTAGYSATIGVAQLAQASNDTNESWVPVSKWAYYNASYGEYSYARDPHASGVINNVSNGKSYGYILSSDEHILQVNMQEFLDSPIRDINETIYDSHALEVSPFESSIQRIAL